ncbi:MAG: GST-like protein [Gammaproteobacteria bacterium]|nr:MAG: GST-like protein [Gammaproteobacteria bacterium]
MILSISLAATGLAGLVNFWLAIRIARLRGKHDVLIGDAGNPQIIAAMRAQANFVEYTPFVLLLTAFVELAKGSSVLLATIAGVYLLGRVAHGVGMTGDVRWRMVGMATTMFTLLVLSIYAVVLAYLSLN